MHFRGIGYAFAASLMFGLGAVLAKLLSGEIDATVVAFVNLAVGGLLLAGIVLYTGTPLFKVLPTLTRRDWMNLFLLSFPGTALPLLLIVAGFTRTSALQGGFLLQLNGVAALIFAALLLKERIRLKQSMGMLLLLLGSLLVVFKGGSGGAFLSGGQLMGSAGLGDLMILAGAVGLGFGLIPAKRLSQRVDTLPLTALRLLMGAVILLPVVLLQLLVAGHTLLWQPSFITLLLVLPTYILTNFCLGYLSQQEGLRLLKAWEMAAITQTVPLFSTTFALLLLHDSMTFIQVCGGLLAVLGGIVVSLSNPAPVADSAKTIVPLQED
ncbi:MAG: DMT family transporter [Ktedonobacteraceae bacterium]